MRLVVAAALVVVALVLAGCGGGTKGSRASTGAVAGAQTEQQFTSPSFDNSAGALEQQISATVSAFRHNGAAAQEAARGLMRANCQGTLSTQLRSRAHTAREHAIVSHLRSACAALSQAGEQAHLGHLAAAQRFAGRALAAAKAAAALSTH
jgi:hypothetical protein